MSNRDTYEDGIKENRRRILKLTGAGAVGAVTYGVLGVLGWQDARNRPKSVSGGDDVPEDRADLTGLYRFDDLHDCIDYGAMSTDRGEVESFASDYDDLGILLESTSESDRYHGTFYEVSGGSDDLVKETKLPYGLDNIALDEGCVDGGGWPW